MCSSLGQLNSLYPVNTVNVFPCMNLESVKSRGQCIKDQVFGPRLLSNVVVCSVYLSKNYIFLRKILVIGAISAVRAC